MKKMLLAIAVLTTGFLFSCNSGGGDPKAVLISFFDALAKKDVPAAKKLATTDSKDMLDMMELGLKNGDKDKTDEKYDKSKMEFGEPKIEGDKATVAVKEKSSGETMNFTLRKESGEWKVAFNKVSLMEMGMNELKESGGAISDSISSGIDKLNDVNIDSLGNEIKEGIDKLKENKEKLEEAGEKIKEEAKKLEN